MAVRALGVLLATRPCTAGAATASVMGITPAQGFLAGGLVIVAVSLAWFAGRSRGRRTVRDDRHLASVLEFADCLLWQAKVTVKESDWTWKFTVQPTGLSRRLFSGRRPPEVGGLWSQFEIAERAEMDRRCRAAVLAGDAGYEQQFHVVKDGKSTWLRESVSISRLETDHYWLVGLVTDVTSHHEAEMARQASEERVRQLLSRSDCLLWQARVVAAEGGFFHWEWFIPDSELYQRIAGGRAMPGRMLWDTAMVPEFAEMDARSRAAMLEGRPAYEHEFRVVLGTTVLWMHEQVAVRPVGASEWTLEGIAIDITAQRLAEESKRQSEAQLQRVLETADFLLWHAQVHLTAEGELHWVLNVPKSQLHHRLFRQEAYDPAMMPWRELVTPEAYAQMVNHADTAITGGAPGYEQVIRGVRGDEFLWLYEQATVRRVSPTEWHLVGIVTDVTTRHVAEEARQASERALREILERADCLLWRATVLRKDDELAWVHFDLPSSRLCNELLGGRMPSASDQLWELADAPDLAEMNARSTQAILSGARGYEQEFRARQNGRLFWLVEQVTITAVGPDEWRLVGVVTDVTQRHEALEAKHQSESRLQELLHRAECLIWHGQVWRQPDGEFCWALSSPKSRLHRRIFGRDPDTRSFSLGGLDVPEMPQMRTTAQAALLAGAPGYEQIFHVPKSDGDIWLNEQVTINPVGADRWEVVGVMTDITARREAEEARRATEAQLQHILELADCMVWHATVGVKPDGGLAWSVFTPQSVLYRRLFGEGNWSGLLDWGRVNVPEIAEINARADAAIRRLQSGYEQEFRVVAQESVIWLREVVTIASHAPGQFSLVGVVTDITAQREAREAQRASVAQVEQMLASADCMLWQARVFEVTPGTLRWVMFVPRSRLHRELFGRDPGEPATLPWAEIVAADCDRQLADRALAAIVSGQDGYEQEFRAQRAERVFWLHERVSITAVAPGEWELVGIMTDLSARRAAEQAVHGSEVRYRTLYQHTPVAIVEADFTRVEQWLAGLRAGGVHDLGAALDADPRLLQRGAKWVRFVDCNDTAMSIFKAKTKSDFRHRRGVLATAEAMQVIRAAMLTIWEGRNTLTAELQMRDFEGGLHDMSVRWWMDLTDRGLDLRQSVMVFVDLTELKQAEAALAAEKERLAVTLRAMAEGVITADTDGRVQFINQAAAAFTQLTPEQAIGRLISEVCVFANDRTGESVEVPVAHVGRGDVFIELPSRTKLTAPDGTSRLVDGCCAPVHSAESEVIGIVLVFRDVTEHERLEQELLRATKLESVGILAGGIAHDFNNILTAVMGNIALAALDVDAFTEAGRSLRQAERAALRARDLTQQLLTFSKGGEPVRAAIQLDAIVREMTTFALHGSNVRATYDVAAGLWPADADKGQIGRVVQNLVLNAVQAMPDGGTVTIMLRNQRVEGLALATVVPGDYVKISITDTGVGIRPEHLSRIFDPYFTTKQSGSGLGLAAVYSIVNKHRGAIDVESQVGGGTTFRIWLPATRTAVDQTGGETKAVGAVVLKGRVLFMDDEESIRQMAVFLLRRFGFEVESAHDGAEAVQKYRAAMAEGNPFALVIMDLTVPGGVGGREAMVQLRALDPNVRAIVSSGYSSDPILANYRAHGFAGVAAKPYDMAGLARVLREVMAV